MTFLTDAYNASFDSVSFMEQFSGQFALEPDSGVESSITHIPGGDVNVIQTSGQGPRKLDLPIAVAGANLTLLRSKATSATRASLVYHAGTTNARLLSVKSVRAAAADDAYFATLELVVG